MKRLLIDIGNRELPSTTLLDQILEYSKCEYNSFRCQSIDSAQSRIQEADHILLHGTTSGIESALRSLSPNPNRLTTVFSEEPLEIFTHFQATRCHPNLVANLVPFEELSLRTITAMMGFRKPNDRDRKLYHVSKYDDLPIDRTMGRVQLRRTLEKVREIWNNTLNHRIEPLPFQCEQDPSPILEGTQSELLRFFDGFTDNRKRLLLAGALRANDEKLVEILIDPAIVASESSNSYILESTLDALWKHYHPIRKYTPILRWSRQFHSHQFKSVKSLAIYASAHAACGNLKEAISICNSTDSPALDVYIRASTTSRQVGNFNECAEILKHGMREIPNNRELTREAMIAAALRDDWSDVRKLARCFEYDLIEPTNARCVFWVRFSDKLGKPPSEELLTYIDTPDKKSEKRELVRLNTKTMLFAFGKDFAAIETHLEGSIKTHPLQSQGIITTCLFFCVLFDSSSKAIPYAAYLSQLDCDKLSPTHLIRMAFVAQRINEHSTCSRLLRILATKSPKFFLQKTPLSYEASYIFAEIAECYSWENEAYAHHTRSRGNSNFHAFIASCPFTRAKASPDSPIPYFPSPGEQHSNSTPTY